ncbi:DedA family protein [Paraclostridium bifermentans]|uniref:DedA family protein n=1 Tax=Paraclostridium bifermentans TaxID=1490 RepID=UPI00359CAD1A
MEVKLLIEEFIKNYGLLSVFIIVMLEYANLPLPSEIVLPVVGIFTFEYDIDFIQVVIVSVLGGVLGSIINYYLGLKLGKPLIDTLAKKFPSTKKSIKASYLWIKKYDKPSIMLSRLVPVARTFISIVAGVVKMNIIVFIIYSTIGISIWNLLLISAGYLLGDNLNIITAILKKYSIIVGVLAILLIAIYYIKSKSKPKEDI